MFPPNHVSPQLFPPVGNAGSEGGSSHFSNDTPLPVHESWKSFKAVGHLVLSIGSPHDIAVRCLCLKHGEETAVL